MIFTFVYIIVLFILALIAIIFLQPIYLVIVFLCNPLAYFMLTVILMSKVSE